MGGFALAGQFPLAVSLLLLMRVASGLIIAWDTTLLLETVPDAVHGRVYSLHTTTYGAVMRGALLVTGLLITVVGVQAIAVGAGIGSMVVGLVWWATGGTRRAPMARLEP